VLKDGQTLGFDLLMLATPYRGCALPFHCISHSSRMMIMLVLIAYTIGVLVGEKIRDRMYRSEKKWYRYSVLFILTRQRLFFPGKEIRTMKVLAYRLFQQMVNAPEVVPTWVVRSGSSS
jgi:hypothetical protein